MNKPSIPDYFIIFSIPGMLNRSRSRSYREDILKSFTSLCRFLETNHLVTVVLLGNEPQVSDQLSVRRRDFTDEGFEFYRRTEQKWFGALDRGTPSTDTRILERELAKLRKERAAENEQANNIE